MFVHHALPIADEVDWIGAQAGKPVPKHKNGSPERDFQEVQVAWLHEHLPAGSVVFAVGNESEAKADTPKARARYQWRRIAAGICPGFPDVGIALPDGRTLYIENKSRRGTVSAAQRNMHATLRALGHTVIVARTIDQTRAGLIAAGVVLAEPGLSQNAAPFEGATAGTSAPRMIRARLGKRTVMVRADRVRA